MTINPNIFKANDIRGVYPDEINEEIAYRVGRALVRFLDAKKVVVGRDCRLSSDALFEALTKGVLKEGAEVIDIGACSSPVFYFSVGEYDLHDGGIMITASHNPKEYNGFKLVRSNVLPIGGVSGMREVKKLVLEDKWEDKAEGKIVETEMLDAYIEKVLSLNPPLSPFLKKGGWEGFKVVADAGNGMGGISLEKLAKHLPIKIIPLYFEPDGNFPNHEANPTKLENLEDLRK